MQNVQGVRVNQPLDLLVFRGGVTRVIDGKGRCGREGIEVLAKGVVGNSLVVGGDEGVKFDGEEI